MGLILTGFVLAQSYGELMKSEGAEHTFKTYEFRAGVTAAVVEVGQISGNLLSKTTLGLTDSPLALRLSFGRYPNFAEGVGKMLGVIGGVLTGVIQIYEGFHAQQEADKIFGYKTAFLGSLSIALAIYLYLGIITAGVALVLALILIAAGYVVSLFKHDKLQHWLNSCYFGLHDLGGKRFRDLMEQQAAYVELVKGD